MSTIMVPPFFKSFLSTCLYYCKFYLCPLSKYYRSSAWLCFPILYKLICSFTFYNFKMSICIVRFFLKINKMDIQNMKSIFFFKIPKKKKKNLVLSLNQYFSLRFFLLQNHCQLFYCTKTICTNFVWKEKKNV